MTPSEEAGELMQRAREEILSALVKSGRDAGAANAIILDFTSEVIARLRERLLAAEVGWISVDERLPKPHTEVRIHPRPTDYICEGRVNTQGQWSYSEYEHNFGEQTHKCAVTHWMPLPPAPGGATGGEG